MSELEELKRRRLEAMQRQYSDQQGQIDEEQQAKEQVAALEHAVKERLSKDALQRYGNIKAADPEKAIQLLVVLGRLIQLGKVGMINDDYLKAVLEKISLQRRETKITRK